jgi:hypothetical protein
VAECRQMARARQGPRERGRGQRSKQRFFVGIFARDSRCARRHRILQDSSPYAETSGLSLWMLSIVNVQCTLGLSAEHVTGRINRSSSDLDPSTRSGGTGSATSPGTSYLPLRNQVLCWILGPTVLHPFPRRCLRFIELNSC